jgi:uncharacterized membrane protein YdjX (TVP38/TMEM64 family)
MDRLDDRPVAARGRVMRWAAAAVAVAIVVWLGRYLGHHLVALEDWVRGLGPAGPLAFLAVFVVLALFCIPDTIFAIAAGVLFSLWIGTGLIVAGVIAAASISFLLARRVLREPVERRLQRSPKLLAIKRALGGAGLRLQFLLRLTPLNPVLVSYVLGSSGVPYRTFLIACAGLIPGLFVEVYLGYAAAHMSKVTSGAQSHPPLHTAIAIGGLIVCILIMVMVTRAARRALAHESNVGSATADAERSCAIATGGDGQVHARPQ